MTMSGGRSSRGGSGRRLGGMCPLEFVTCRACSSWPRRDRFLCYVPFAAIAMTITIAAKIELFTYLACQAHKPNVHPGDQGTDLVLIARNVISSFGGELILCCRIVSRALSMCIEPSQRTCAQDPVVQAAVAKLSVITTTSMGILACMTAAWWGSVSRQSLRYDARLPRNRT